MNYKDQKDVLISHYFRKGMVISPNRKGPNCDNCILKVASEKDYDHKIPDL